MELLADWRFIACGIAASFIIGMSRGGFAGGVAFLGVLIMAQLVPAKLAAAFILPILCFADPIGNYAYRHHVHWRNVRILLAGGLVGSVIGGVIFYYVNDHAIRLLVALLAFYMVADRIISHRKYSASHVYPAWIGAFLGMLGGITSFIIHAGQPPVSAYLLPQKLPRLLYIGTFAAVFTTLNYFKLAPYSMLGLLDLSLLKVSAIFFPVVVVGFFFGRWLTKRISDRAFYMVTYVTVAVLGIKLGIEGLVGIGVLG